MELTQNQFANNDERMTKLLEGIKKTCEVAHITTLAAIKSEKACKAIRSTDKKHMWDVLQEYYKQYKSFINKYTPITGFHIYDVDAAFYEQCTIEDIRST